MGRYRKTGLPGPENRDEPVHIMVTRLKTLKALLGLWPMLPDPEDPPPKKMQKRYLVPLWLTAAMGCISPSPPPKDSSESVVSSPRGAPITYEHSPALDELRQLEDGRWDGGGRLYELARSDDERVRAKAIRVLGRLPYPRFGRATTRALCRALADESRLVRHNAAFALGLRGDPECVDELRARLTTEDPVQRAFLIEAAGRFDDPKLQDEVLAALEDPDPMVQHKAATATALWDPKASNAERVNRDLIEVLTPFSERRHQRTKNAAEAEFVWRLLYALSRRGAELGRASFLKYANSRNTLEQLFSLRGLAQLPADESSVEAVIEALGSTDDWRCAYEATVALKHFGDPRAIPALKRAVEDASAHVRAGTVEALAAFPNDREKILPLLQRGSLDLSAAVRSAALRARVRLHAVDDALEILVHRSRDEDPIVRLAVTQMAEEIVTESESVLPLLNQLTGDPSLLVATRAVEALGSHLAADVRAGLYVRASLYAFLKDEDNGKRLAAVMGLRRQPAPSDIEPLIHAFEGSQGDISNEVAFNVLQNLGAIGGDSVERFLRSKIDDPRPYVAQVAREVLHDAFAREIPGPAHLPPVSDEPVPVAGRDYPVLALNPIVEINTSRGKMSFELFPMETPQHVHNFLKLVEEGQYHGTTFHRVVPDFVVQGGDRRGDGNGAVPWRGEGLRHEFTPRPYERGALGMPRNADPDSGGSQFFITHRPTPHLDGRYTIFGMLRAGGEVLDRIEVGDRILEIRILP